ncbi:MAG: hypothetical protein IT235_05865 [Bacteroidia bacterium]|nr:hypothetical protein [Bacteroidia bacterium]
MPFNEKIKRVLFAIILAVLAIPFIQQNLKLVAIKALHGAIVNVPDSTFTIERWLNENYQKQQECYLNQQFGFRNSFIRLNNEIHFRLFNAAKANGVIVGKQNYLFEIGYINAYYGMDFIGMEKIDDNVKKLKQLSDTLKKMGKDLIIVFAPGKASYYPEYIPDKYKTNVTITNYSYYLKKIKENGLNNIDFNSYFVEKKKTSKYLLYPKTGIHWSMYGIFLVSDSLVKYIEKLRNIDMPEIKCSEVIYTDSIHPNDMDIERGMNLLFPISKPKMAYPVYKYNMQNKTKPSVITVADSYYWSIYGTNMVKALFERPRYWYYFKEFYAADSYMKTIDVINFEDEINKNDIIILMATEANLAKFPWGFIEKMNEIYLSKDARERKIKKLIDQIVQSPEWFDKIKKSAIAKNISLDSMLRSNAIYMIEQEKK